MKIAYFDTIAGISGDMTLGAFVSAGVSLDVLITEIGKLNLKGVELNASHRERNGIAAVKVEVVLSAGSNHHMNLEEIISLIDESSLSVRVKQDAKKIFMEVARAEAKVHNTTVGKIHFHEVGALDSIVDIVGAAICLEQCGIEQVYSSPVKLGSGGFVDTDHGKLPIPGPAVVEILRNYPTMLTDIPYELTTPTGAAIIKATSSGILTNEQLKIDSVGYGAGTREMADVPNILRVIIGELEAVKSDEEILLVETNIDDMNPEIVPFVIEKLLASGANDAYITSVIMKKGRSGLLLSAIVGRRNLDEIVKVIFTQTTTLGVRIHAVWRKILSREQRRVNSSFGEIVVKAVVYNGQERYIPEYEECLRIAEEKGIPLLQVYRTLEKEFSSLT